MSAQNGGVQETGWAARLPLRLVGTRPALLAPAHLLSSVPSISNKELSELIEQLQKNADQVEKNIVDTEAKMQSVSAPPPRRHPVSPIWDQSFARPNSVYWGGGWILPYPRGTCGHIWSYF